MILVDYSRVTLPSTDDDNSDYINANFVQVYMIYGTHDPWQKYRSFSFFANQIFLHPSPDAMEEFRKYSSNSFSHMNQLICEILRKSPNCRIA
jgi:protein tyrosine phosphatase